MELKEDIDLRVAGIVYASLTFLWALAILGFVIKTHDAISPVSAFTTTVVLWLLSFPVWLLLFPMIAAPIALAINALFSRLRA